MPLKPQIDEPPALNLTSMIDVVFLLVIFFMVGSRFTSNEQKIDVKVPSVGASKALSNAPEKLAIHLLKDGRLALGNRFVSESELIGRLTEERERNPSLGVILRGDAEIPLQRVAVVLAACRESGVSNIGVSVRLAKAVPSKRER